MNTLVALVVLLSVIRSVHSESDGGSETQVVDGFKFPEGWNAHTAHEFQKEKDAPLVERFTNQLRRYIYETEPEYGVRTVALHGTSLGCDRFCVERWEWDAHKNAFQIAKFKVFDELRALGFEIEVRDSLKKEWATFYGTYIFVS